MIYEAQIILRRDNLAALVSDFEAVTAFLKRQEAKTGRPFDVTQRPPEPTTVDRRSPLTTSIEL